MRTWCLSLSLATVTLVAAAQQPQPAQLPATEPATAVYPLDGAFLQWPLPPGGQAYADIDGVNGLELKDLQRPPEAEPGRGQR